MKTSQILKAMKIVSWIIFIGICIKVGAILISFIVSLFVNQEATKDLYLGLDLSSIYSFSPSLYVIFVFFMLFLLAVQAFIFFLVIKLFSKFDERNPFSQATSILISKIGYSSLFAGFVALAGTAINKWLINQGVSVSFDWSAEEFLFMSGVIFIIGLFFKRGVEIQSENELTI